MHTISYSYGALHNAPGHIGQFCNPKFFSTYFFQKQNSTKAAHYFWYKRRNKGNHKFPKLLLKDTHAALQSGSLISTTQSSPLSQIRTWANRSTVYGSTSRGEWLTEEVHRNRGHSGQRDHMADSYAHNSWLNLELLVPRTIHEGHS